MTTTANRRYSWLARELRKSFGSRLARIRTSASPKVSQGALGEALGVSRASVSNMEHGRHRVFLDQVYICASVLGCELTDLLPSIEELENADAVSLPEESGLEALRPMIEKRVQDIIAIAQSRGDVELDDSESEL